MIPEELIPQAKLLVSALIVIVALRVIVYLNGQDLRSMMSFFSKEVRSFLKIEIHPRTLNAYGLTLFAILIAMFSISGAPILPDVNGGESEVNVLLVQSGATVFYLLIFLASLVVCLNYTHKD